MKPIDELLAVMARLRNKENGCPWDIEQNFSSIAPHTIEEAYEVADAIDRNDMPSLREELGDLLLQVVFHAQMAEEASLFDFDDVARAINDKLIRRHPHIFGDADIKTADEQSAAWESIKASERQQKSATPSLLDDVPVGFPALTRALKLQKRAATVGFDWSDVKDILTKLHEEVAELEEAAATQAKDKVADELGDVLFVCANIARHYGIDPEEALRGTNRKFDRRFRHIESELANRQSTPAEASLEEMDALWNAAKALERKAG